MGDLTGDTWTQTRLSEKHFLDKKWNEVLEEIFKLFYVRLYYSNGRYHFEQITTRDNVSFKRHTYQADGTFIASTTVNLDINFNTLPVDPETGGTNKMLAPLKSVSVETELDDDNLIGGIRWDQEHILWLSGLMHIIRLYTIMIPCLP
jgi:hypothetical protein